MKFSEYSDPEPGTWMNRLRRKAKSPAGQAELAEIVIERESRCGFCGSYGHSTANCFDKR